MNARGGSLSDRDIDDILALFTGSELTMQEAEEAIQLLQGVRHRVVERLLGILQNLDTQSAGERAADERQDSPDAALILLTYLGDTSVVPRLMAMVDDRSVTDDLKLKIISVIHEIEPKADTEALLGHLHHPGKAMQRSHREHVQRLRSPLELMLWLDMMAEEMSPEVRISFARYSADIDVPSAVPLLICMCYDPDDDVALAAMDAVERYKDARALPALEELAAHHPSQPVRSEARKAADRLHIRTALAPQVELTAPPPLYACHLTTIDGSGGQVAVLTRQVFDGIFRLIEIPFRDDQGIGPCFGADVRLEELDDLFDDLAAQGLSPVPVPYAQFVAALDLACEITWQAGRLLPTSFVAWREWITWERVNQTPSGERTQPAESLTPSIPLEERDQRLHDCLELLFQDEFVHWFFHPDEIGDLGNVYWNLVEERGRALELPALQSLLRQGVREIVTDEVRGLIQGRLRRVAPLLRELYEDEEVWQWAIVAADALADDSPLPPEEHPLLLGMVAFSLENAVDEAVDWVAAI